MTEVTNSIQADMNNITHLAFDQLSGTSMQKMKVFLVLAPNDSEGASDPCRFVVSFVPSA